MYDGTIPPCCYKSGRPVIPGDRVETPGGTVGRVVRIEWKRFLGYWTLDLIEDGGVTFSYYKAEECELARSVA